MNQTEATQLIRDVFEQPFDEARFTRFVRELLNEIDESKATRPIAGQTSPLSFRGHVRQCRRGPGQLDRAGHRGYRMDASACARYNAAIDHPRPRPRRDEARHSREGIPTGSEMMSSVTFRGITIRRQDVLRALAEFDAVYGDDTNAYDGWLDKGVYRYALDVGGRLYPPKHILSVVSGFPTTDFSGGEQTNRVFQRLGFEVREK